jgi:outer membrane lipoprotein-sorting protein
VRELLLEADARDRIRRVRITETDGAVTEFRLSAETPSPPLDNAMFQFRPPPGVEVVEQETRQ